MTHANPPADRGAGGAPAPTGADLARIALHQARQDAKQHGASQPRTSRRHRAGPVRHGGREPYGFAAVLQNLMADRAWELPAAGGTVLDRWPDIAATIAPQLPAHAQAVAFHPGTGQLDLLPDTTAYATQLRLISARIITVANETTGTRTVRTIRVLHPGAVAAQRPARPAPPSPAPAAPEKPIEARETVTAGYREAVAAHRATWTRQQHSRPEIQAAAERQLRERLREPEEHFADGHQALASLRSKATAQQRVRPSDVSRARAQLRLDVERAELPSSAPTAAVPKQMDGTA